MAEPTKSPRPSHGRHLSNGIAQQPEDPSSKRRFGFIPFRPSDEKTATKRRKIENNPLGLTKLYSPPEPQVDLVFVHGLRGGSVKTWCDNEDLNLFWPKEWIAVDEDLRHRVRTSSFGYANDWLTSKSSQLSLQDFGRDLIYQLDNSPYLRKDQHTPIVLIGHSMGGLVIKKACLLAYQQRKQIADRIKCIIFLATPHRGSSAAELLSSLLDLVGWEKPFVEDLCRDSSALQVINDEFSRVANSENLRLWSLYETRPMIGSRLIVRQGSAVLGYDNEEVNMVLADHRSICKFKTPEDKPYLDLRNTLLRITDELTSESHVEILQEKMLQMTSLETYLNIVDPSQFDLDQQCDKQVEQSCTWLEQRLAFQSWLDGDEHVAGTGNVSPHLRTLQRRPTLPPSRRCRVYWLTGNPGTGKSVCTAHVITRLQSLKRDCVYHFFRAGERDKARVSAMLLSIAFQMAEMHPSIRKALTELQKARTTFDRDDDGAIWRKLFVNCILKSPIQKPQYWIIDAVDECTAENKLFQKLSGLECSFDLRIFMTSRHSSKLESMFQKLGSNIDTMTDTIQARDTEADMRLYLLSRLDRLPVDDPSEREAMVEKLLLKANSSFLWLNLVSRELEEVYSQISIDEVLQEIPFEMSELYKRSLESLRTLKRASDRPVAKAILTWSAYATRPLTVEELTTALNQYDGDDVTKLETPSEGYKVPNLKAMIEGPASGLLFVDGRSYVQFAHATAREYIIGALDSSFEVTRAAGNEKLARACLRCLVKELAPTRSHSLRASETVQTRNRTVFTNYASSAFSEHFAASSSSSSQLFRDVASFLSSTALAWIEHIATEQPSLYPLTRAAKNIKEFLRRRAKREPPLGFDFSTLDGWSTDLIRLVAKFGRNLRGTPSSIRNIIPMVAPRQSKLSQALRGAPRWIEMAGPTSENWDDCVSAIQYKASWGTALATGENIFAVGLKDGTVIVYDQSTCQEILSVKHRLPGEMSHIDSDLQKRPPLAIRLLAFHSSDTQFASASGHAICVWSIEGDLLHIFSLKEPCVSIRFSVDLKELLGITRSSQVARWPLWEEEDNMLPIPAAQTRRLSTGNTRVQVSDLPRQAPLAAAISPDQSMLAILYRGRPIYICSLEDDTVLGVCGRDAGSDASNISVQTALFNPNPELSLLAVAYQDGELAVYDPWTLKELVSVDGDAYTMAATPDGRTLGTGNNSGTINLWDFETLCLLYAIRSGCDDVRSLAFSGDGLRIVDIRDSSTKIWEPSALVRRSADENASMSDGVALDAPIVGVNEEIVSITVMCPDDVGQLVFAGLDDGSVVAYGVSTGVLDSHIYSHTQGIFISAIAFRDGILCTADAGGRIIVRKLLNAAEQNNGGLLLLQVNVIGPVRQLLFNDGGSRLLIATAKSTAVWNLQTGQKCTESMQQSNILEPTCQWVRLGKSLGAVTQSSLELYYWDTLEQISTLLLPTPVRLEGPNLTASVREVLLQSLEYDFVACAISLADFPGTVLAGWTTNLLQNAAMESQSPRSFSLDLPGKIVKVFIGIHSDLAVFLDEDLWVCSVRLCDTGRHTTPQLQRHFFIPSDLLRGSTGCTPILTGQGNIVFAKEGDLVIVKGGLSWSCS